MRTPEEIKKWLEHCAGVNPCIYCPYSELSDFQYTCETELFKDALAYIKQLEDHMRNDPKMVGKDINVPRWISVKEMFPKHKQVVLAYVDPCLEIVQWNEADGLWEADTGWFGLDSVTHWMPLSEPPKEDDGNE